MSKYWWIGDPLVNFFEKSQNSEKKLKGGPFSLARYCMLRGKKRKILFGSVPWANRYNLRFCRTFGRTILVTSGVSKKKTLTKSHDYSLLFSQEKRRLKIIAIRIYIHVVCCRSDDNVRCGQTGGTGTDDRREPGDGWREQVLASAQQVHHHRLQLQPGARHPEGRALHWQTLIRYVIA